MQPQPPVRSAKTQPGSTEGQLARSCPLVPILSLGSGGTGEHVRHVALPPSHPISPGLRHKIISRDTAGKRKVFRMSSVSAREGHGTSVRGTGNDSTGAQKLTRGQLPCHPASSQRHVIN